MLLEALTKDEFMRLLAIAYERDRRTWLMMVLQFWHAGRNSEVVGLRRDNFDGDHIKFKRLKGSEPCDQELVEHENPLLNERAAVFAFLENLSGKQRLFQMSRFTYLRRVKKLAIAAGIRPSLARTTSMKHCLCTFMLENTSANAVQRRAGHVNGANTLKYAKLRESQVDKIVRSAIALP